jgi:hypothetical protein
MLIEVQMQDGGVALIDTEDVCWVAKHPQQIGSGAVAFRNHPSVLSVQKGVGEIINAMKRERISAFDCGQD